MKQRTIERLRGLAAVELIALLIALALPLTPSRTGADAEPGDLFMEKAGYVDHVVVGFLMVHAIFLVLAVAVWVVTLVGERRDGSGT